MIVCFLDEQTPDLPGITSWGETKEGAAGEKRGLIAKDGD